MRYFEERTPFAVSDDWASMSKYEHSIFVFAVGYESRSIALLKRLKDYTNLDHFTLCGFTFKKFANAASRPENDEFLREHGISCEPLNGFESDQFVGKVREVVETLNPNYERIRLIVDYSSMPRNWYCSLMIACMNDEWPIDVDWLYVGGNYSRQEYPCVGYGEFKRFIGVPRASGIEQTHIFGLGFDSIRTYGIWNYLDPQRTWCLIASPREDLGTKERVREKNSEIINGSIAVSDLLVESFPALLSAIGEIVQRLSTLGDVSLVPDGPKPLVLAMSIIPKVVGIEGVLCWHVGHVKPQGYEPLDVSSTGICYPFRLTVEK